jgi:hypothetical protein
MYKGQISDISERYSPTGGHPFWSLCRADSFPGRYSASISICLMLAFIASVCQLNEMKCSSPTNLTSSLCRMGPVLGIGYF